MQKRARESSPKRREANRPEDSLIAKREEREKIRRSKPVTMRPRLKRGAVFPTPKSLRAFSIQPKEGER